ncbi:unnamed protein product, partial [marine sediment metagenome]
MIENIPVGSYSLEVTHPDFQTYTTVIDISPELTPTSEYQKELDQTAFALEYGELVADKNLLELKLERAFVKNKNLTTACRVFCGLSIGLAGGTGAMFILIGILLFLLALSMFALVNIFGDRLELVIGPQVDCSVILAIPKEF